MCSWGAVGPVGLGRGVFPGLARCPPPNTSGAPSGARGCLWLTVSPPPALPSGTLLSQEQA